MTKLLSLFLLVFIGKITLAQTAETFSISGRAISRYSGRPIRGGSVLITKNFGTSTNMAGEFSILGRHPGKYKLSFSSIGYKKKDTIITIEGKNISGLVLSVSVDCKRFNNKKAIKDLDRKKAILFVNSRESARDLAADQLFQTKYGIQLKYGGFEVSTEDCMVIYNRVVIEHLDKEYGKKWRDDLQESIFGLR